MYPPFTLYLGAGGWYTGTSGGGGGGAGASIFGDGWWGA